MMHKPWQRWTALACLLTLSAFFLGQAWSQQPPLTAEQRMKRDITFLASDECEGRGPGTKGIDRAADYIADQFKKAGLKPAGPKGGYFQPFTIAAGQAKLKGKPALALRGPQGQRIELSPGAHFAVLSGS